MRRLISARLLSCIFYVRHSGVTCFFLSVPHIACCMYCTVGYIYATTCEDVLLVVLMCSQKFLNGVAGTVCNTQVSVLEYVGDFTN